MRPCLGNLPIDNSNNHILPLQAQEYQLGQLIQSLYFSPSAPSLISGVSTSLFNQAQVHIRADAGGEGGVIFDSSIAVAQGIWPASTGFNTTLANGKFFVICQFGIWID